MQAAAFVELLRTRLGARFRHAYQGTRSSVADFAQPARSLKPRSTRRGARFRHAKLDIGSAMISAKVRARALISVITRVYAYVSCPTTQSLVVAQCDPFVRVCMQAATSGKPLRTRRGARLRHAVLASWCRGTFARVRFDQLSSICRFCVFVWAVAL